MSHVPHGSSSPLRDHDAEVLDEKTFRDWIARRVPEDAQLPLVRKAIYGFHARVATHWKDGRVLLAGDAAHLTPPFAGQGLNSGIRDATNLAWKLSAVTHWGATPDLLESYEQERRPHAAALIRMALRIGAFMQPKSVVGAVITQTALRLACLVPALRDHILQLRFKPKPQFAAGYFTSSVVQPHSELLPQPMVQCPDGGTARLDELLGNAFAVIGYATPAFHAAAERLLPHGMPGKVFALVRRDDDFLFGDLDSSVQSIRDVSGELGALLERCGAVAIVVRPDRYGYSMVNESQLRDLASASAAIPSDAAVRVHVATRAPSVAPSH